MCMSFLYRFRAVKLLFFLCLKWQEKGGMPSVRSGTKIKKEKRR